eukprot:NODE_203_length_14950_cov_0.414450.p2 type:complete len:406 gc:universal NODE_203_length_14950_cov_0.414450:13125-11908(-)
MSFLFSLIKSVSSTDQLQSTIASNTIDYYTSSAVNLLPSSSLTNSSATWSTSSATVSLTDCQKLEKLAIGLHLNTKQPFVYSQVQNDCCSASGITCYGDTVVGINWSGMNLDGTILGQYLPSSLESLDLHNTAATAAITGSIPNPLPDSLTFINVGYNKLTGVLPQFPPNIQSFQFHSNKISCPFPRSLPASLTTFNGWSNSLTGTLPPLPPSLYVLYIGDNRMNGTLPTIPSGMLYFHIGFLPGNRFTGKVELWSPISFKIEYQLFTEVVFHDTAAMATCIISYTPLLEHANDPQLQGCVMTGIYSAALLPITISRLSSTSRTLSSYFTTKSYSNSVTSLYTFNNTYSNLSSETSSIMLDTGYLSEPNTSSTVSGFIISTHPLLTQTLKSSVKFLSTSLKSSLS